MFGFLEDIAKAVVGVVTLPISIVADIPKVFDPYDNQKTRTGTNVDSILDNLEKAVKPSWAHDSKAVH